MNEAQFITWLYVCDIHESDNFYYMRLIKDGEL